MGLDGHKTVIDRGAGMSKFTGRLVATGAQVIAVELPEGQRAQVDEQISALIAAEPQLRGTDVVRVPYETAAFVVVNQG